jgi:hypothetical protein
MSFTEQQPLTDTSSNQTGRKNTAHGSNASDLKDMFVFGGSSISSTASKESFPTYADAITQTNTLFTRDDIANRPELNGWLFLRSCDYLLNRFLAAKTMVRAADGSRKLKEPYHVQSLQEAETRCGLAQNPQSKEVSEGTGWRPSFSLEQYRSWFCDNLPGDDSTSVDYHLAQGWRADQLVGRVWFATRST